MSHATVQCCMCKKYRVNGKWISFDHEPIGFVTSTYCDKCHKEKIKEVDDFFKDKPETDNELSSES